MLAVSNCRVGLTLPWLWWTLSRACVSWLKGERINLVGSLVGSALAKISLVVASVLSVVEVAWNLNLLPSNAPVAFIVPLTSDYASPL